MFSKFWQILLLYFYFPFNPLLSKELSTDIGLKVFEAYQKYYPQRVLAIDKRKDDWAIKVGEAWFLWSHGRILREDIADNPSLYYPLSFYYYPKILPPLPRLTGEKEQKFLEQMEKDKELREETEVSPYFLSSLYQSYNKDQTVNDWITEITFIGFPVKVNKQIVEPLKKIETILKDRSLCNIEIKNFLSDLKSISGFYWRKMAFFKKRSYHSFGFAIDFIPQKWKGQAYWYWAKKYHDDWYNLPYSERWHVPLEIVDIFEKNGFIWGGKWLFFDNMHFEYRPELQEIESSWSKKR